MGQGWWTGMLLFFVTSLLQFGRLVMIAHLSSWCEHVDFAAAVCAPRETCAVEGMGITTVEAFLTASKIKWCQKFKRREGDASSRPQVRSGKLQFQGESSVTLEWPNGPKGILKSYAGWQAVDEHTSVDSDHYTSRPLVLLVHAARQSVLLVCLAFAHFFASLQEASGAIWAVSPMFWQLRKRSEPTKRAYPSLRQALQLFCSLRPPPSNCKLNDLKWPESVLVQAIQKTQSVIGTFQHGFQEAMILDIATETGDVGKWCKMCFYPLKMGMWRINICQHKCEETVNFWTRTPVATRWGWKTKKNKTFHHGLRFCKRLHDLCSLPTRQKKDVEDSIVPDKNLLICHLRSHIYPRSFEFFCEDGALLPVWKITTRLGFERTAATEGGAKSRKLLL